MATLRNKRKIAAVSRETPEGSRSSRGQTVLDPELTQDYISQVSEEIEGRVTKKLSKEFSKTESRILGALSKLDEFFLNPQVRTCSVAVQGTSRNANSENREIHEDCSVDDPYPEVGYFPHHSGQLHSPETETISHMVTENYPHTNLEKHVKLLCKLNKWNNCSKFYYAEFSFCFDIRFFSISVVFTFARFARSYISFCLYFDAHVSDVLSFGIFKSAGQCHNACLDVVDSGGIVNLMIRIVRAVGRYHLLREIFGWWFCLRSCVMMRQRRFWDMAKTALIISIPTNYSNSFLQNDTFRIAVIASKQVLIWLVLRMSQAYRFQYPETFLFFCHKLPNIQSNWTEI